ncbi:MAG: hypothetical protein ACYDDF_08865 [Thermoplasmatota archaeon]
MATALDPLVLVETLVAIGTLGAVLVGVLQARLFIAERKGRQAREELKLFYKPATDWLRDYVASDRTSLAYPPDILDPLKRENIDVVYRLPEQIVEQAEGLNRAGNAVRRQGWILEENIQREIGALFYKARGEGGNGNPLDVYVIIAMRTHHEIKYGAFLGALWSRGRSLDSLASDAMKEYDAPSFEIQVTSPKGAVTGAEATALIEEALRRINDDPRAAPYLEGCRDLRRRADELLATVEAASKKAGSRARFG